MEIAAGPRRHPARDTTVAYSFFNHTGDVGVEVRAATLDDVFAEAALAFAETVTDPRLVAAAVSAAVELRAPAVDLLLVDWLNDLVYRLDAERLIVAHARIAVAEHAGAWAVRGTVSGDRLDPARHPIKTLVKAATYHGLQVTRAADEWHARFVLDV